MQVNFKAVADEGHCKHTFFWCVKRAGTESPHQCRPCKAWTLQWSPRQDDKHASESVFSLQIQ